MSTRTMTLEEIRRAGLGALARELGPVGMVRFLQQFDSGSGNYSKDRHDWLGDVDVDTVVERIQRRRATRHGASGR